MRPGRRGSAVRLEPDDLRDYARVLVRAGYLDRTTVVAEVAQAAREDHGLGQPETVASEIVAEVVQGVRTEQAGWPTVTDHDRLVAAFAELRTRGVLVLAYVDDHWTATGELERRDECGERAVGVVWFTRPDVWHAVLHGMLEVNLWHGDTANAAPGDALLDDVLAVLSGHGLAAHFDEGRIEVACAWQRRSAY